LARKFLYAIAVLVVLVIGTLFGLNFWAKELSEYAFVPAVRYQPPAAPLPDAYGRAQAWISQGTGTPADPARWLPAGVPRPAPLPVAVFFVHPTTLYDRTRWNAGAADPAADHRAELFTQGLASPFNAARELWAPRYRQATIGAFLTDKPEGKAAIAAAYADVLAAFDHFLAHTDPALPIVLVGHSQGALHVLRLLQDRVAAKKLARRVVAAYVVGWPVSEAHDLPATGLAACTAPSQTGCLLSWQSYAEPADTHMADTVYARFAGLDGQSRQGSAFLCTNPLTGMAGKNAPASANLGTLVPDAHFQGASLAQGLVAARCAPSGYLLIGPAAGHALPDLGPYVLPGNNYHVYDVPLFWANIRADFATRVAAWHKARWWRRTP